ncbi:MAG TPA: hypothetical protein IAC12_03950 [Candidatus Aphodovivens avistercoris]|nr:hypothetical protein [Candidatus Aphodovivens avistercoris]
MTEPSQLAILVGAIALICVISMMLHVRAEKTRTRVDEFEQRLARLERTGHATDDATAN